MALLFSGGALYTPGELHSPGALLVDGGVIRACGPAGSFPAPRNARRIDTAGQYVTPGLVDLHLHGFGGHDVAGPGLAEVIRLLPSVGVTAFLATTVAAPAERLLPVLQTMAGILEQPPQGARALGIHMEGPWVSPLRSGGMRAEFCRPPTRQDVENHLVTARGSVRMVTLAPEEGAAMALIPWLCQKGVVPSIGHSDANYETVARAVAVGLSHATHTFNAMPPLHQRRPGALGAVLDHPTIIAQLIADGYHVHPALMRLLVKAKGVERVCLVSDAMFTAGLPEGEYEWDGRRLVRDGDTSRFPDGALAGSAMPLDRMLRVVQEQVGLSFGQALAMAAEVPARVLGLRTGRLAVGYDADLVVWQEDGRPALTIVGGRVVYQSRS